MKAWFLRLPYKVKILCYSYKFHELEIYPEALGLTG